MTHEEWVAEGKKLFGDEMDFAFVCPVCKHVQTVRDYKAAGAPLTTVAFSCVGRWIEGSKEAWTDGDNSKGCSYAGGGLFRMNPVTVTFGSEAEAMQVFDYARKEEP